MFTEKQKEGVTIILKFVSQGTMSKEDAVKLIELVAVKEEQQDTSFIPWVTPNDQPIQPIQPTITTSTCSANCTPESCSCFAAAMDQDLRGLEKEKAKKSETFIP